jgi:hypothetical protein
MSALQTRLSWACLTKIVRQVLAGAGVGCVDAHRLASARLTPGAKFRALDKRSSAVADHLGPMPGRDG